MLNHFVVLILISSGHTILSVIILGRVKQPKPSLHTEYIVSMGIKNLFIHPFIPSWNTYHVPHALFSPEGTDRGDKNKEGIDTQWFKPPMVSLPCCPFEVFGGRI